MRPVTLTVRRRETTVQAAAKAVELRGVWSE